MRPVTTRTATMAGLLAIVLWSSMVGMIRLVTENMGAIGGAAMIYSCCVLLLTVTIGWPNLRKFGRVYLFTGALSFAAYEVCFALAVGLADTPRQAIEVGIVNYLWPSLTVVFAIVFTGQKASLLVVPGVLLSIVGIAVVLGADTGFDVATTVGNIRSNPLSYCLAFAGALIWAGYCTLTNKYAKGQNGITPFFALTAVSFWVLYLFAADIRISFTLSGIGAVLIAACAIGFGYALWNVGILHGNLTLLAAASYFTPVLSAAFSSVLLATALGLTFWIGAAVVCLGALLCWVATRQPLPVAQPPSENLVTDTVECVEAREATEQHEEEHATTEVPRPISAPDRYGRCDHRR
ncbi:aromatic amino acid DMT transporter YddG [Rhodococcus fascians]|nr:aromatic amino acid DMT transporter YddG [Rhodococcus fascians]MBY4237862.1 aromatic amino acid DMT transporter YddG [Rhodococcus fascians]MBY4253387.1 aromatic amino acid DMT transporter YddG [Rhodococcus fascians]MBY4269024.1 aromatic amino acid DMT transporter YddG [Rhodococcus fascians]MBY4275077.1 aromatic amino acid DMT transporter YddG [Rhodococcus fascians]